MCVKRSRKLFLASGDREKALREAKDVSESLLDLLYDLQEEFPPVFKVVDEALSLKSAIMLPLA